MALPRKQQLTITVELDTLSPVEGLRQAQVVLDALEKDLPKFKIKAVAVKPAGR